MEFLIILVVVIALCLCLGVSIETVILGIMVLLVLTLLLIVGMFVYCLFCLVGSKKVTARFLKFGTSSSFKYKVAFYTIDGEDYPNALPCEIIFQKRLYKADKNVFVRLTKKKSVYDTNALATVAVGIFAGGFSAMYAIVYLAQMFTV